MRIIEDNPIDEFKSSWNMAGGLSEQINTLLTSANDNYIKGNLHEAWKRMKAVYLRIIQLLSEEQETDITNLSNQVCALTLVDNDPKKRALASKLYDKLNGKIMKVLQDKGLLLQGQKDATRMKF